MRLTATPRYLTLTDVLTLLVVATAQTVGDACRKVWALAAVALIGGTK